MICMGKMKGSHGVGEGGCLGVVSIGCRGDAAPSWTATSLVSVSGTGSTWSARGIGGLRGVVVIKDVLSTRTGLAAKGQGVREFTCPLVFKKGGTEIQEFSLSLGVMTG